MKVWTLIRILQHGWLYKKGYGVRAGSIFFQDFGIEHLICYTFLRNWLKVRYAFSKNWHKLGYACSKNWQKERVCFWSLDGKSATKTWLGAHSGDGDCNCISVSVARLHGGYESAIKPPFLLKDGPRDSLKTKEKLWVTGWVWIFPRWEMLEDYKI